jgi:NAD-dependent deacetylase
MPSWTMDFTDAQWQRIERVVDLLVDCRSLLFITGAGLSADSGLPTYRGIGGLYDVEVTEEGLPIEEILSGYMIRRCPEVTWKYLLQIAHTARQATFNRGHEVIAEMERHFERVWTLTQNVDGFHRAAGAANVIEIHGDLHDLCCTSCDFRKRVDCYEGLDIPPRCPVCGAVVRPDVVLFGELLPEAKVGQLFEQCCLGFDMVFTVGTSSVFPYIAEPVRHAKTLGRPTVEINPGDSEVSHLVDVKLAMRAAPALDAIWQRYRQRQEIDTNNAG